MEIRQLRYFVKIADCASFSKASQVLYVAQPALSQQMNQLESELGQPLLHRRYNGVHMTEQGHVFYRHAQRILKDIEDLPNVVRQVGANLTGTVALGLPQSTAVHYALPMLELLRLKQSGIALELFDEISGNLLRGVQSNRFHLAVLVNDDGLEQVETLPVMDEELFLVSRSRQSLPEVVPMASLCDYVLALPGLHQGVRSLVEGAVAASGGRLPRPSIEANSMSIMLRAVETGLACSILPWAAINEHLSDGRLHAAPLSPPLTRRV